MQESGGHFDAIIDDGSHLASDIMNTFDALWPHVNPGGVYFIEDLQIGRSFDSSPKGVETSEDTNGRRVVSDVMQAWVEQLLAPYPPRKLHNGAPVLDRAGNPIVDHKMWQDTPSNKIAIELRARHPLPPDVAFVFCQAEACAIGKQMPYKDRTQACRNAVPGQAALHPHRP